ncbi:MAG: serine/threonine protein kinase, partial [Thermoleophilaceae bacterium]|nr:serine/threonine protein kinase [Thermoleophilaceae bacterium]
IQKIGSGGMSVVLMCEDTVLQRVVALKMLADHLASDQDFVTRFRHEALAVAKLQHPNIVQVFDSGSDTTTNQYFIVMEYVEGQPLSDMLRGGRKLEPARAVAISADACEALECAHRAGVIHRDVKPANLIVTREGQTKLADFGIAKASEMTRVTQVGSVLGTVAYLSPEQATGGDTGPQSDIYSLAVVTYEMLGGRLPYLYKSITELAMKQRDELPTPLIELNPVVPVELDRTIRVALSYDPKLRFATAREFAQAMRTGLQRRESEFVTKVLSDPAAATRMMAARGREAERTRVAPIAAAAAGAAGAAAGAGDATQVTRVAATPERTTGSRPPARPPASRKTTRRLTITVLAIAAVIAAGVLGVMLGDTKPAPVNQDTVQSQIDGLRGFIQDHR